VIKDEPQLDYVPAAWLAFGCIALLAIVVVSCLLQLEWFIVMWGLSDGPLGSHDGLFWACAAALMLVDCVLAMLVIYLQADLRRLEFRPRDRWATAVALVALVVSQYAAWRWLG